MEKVVLGPERNNERPLAAADLLEEAAQYLRKRYDEEKGDDMKQPFLVDTIWVDPRLGLVKLILRPNN